MSEQEKKPAEPRYAPQPDFFVDPQTNTIFPRHKENLVDISAAWGSIIYSVAILPYLCWLLLDTWTGRYSTWPLNFFANQMQGGSPRMEALQILCCCSIAGGIGAAVNNIRSILLWHSERRSFGWRFVWKYLSVPPLGATLAVIVYSIVRGGVAAISGGSVESHDVAGKSELPLFSALATGALAGYSSQKVLVWLDHQANSLFKAPSREADSAGDARDENSDLKK